MRIERSPVKRTGNQKREGGGGRNSGARKRGRGGESGSSEAERRRSLACVDRTTMGTEEARPGSLGFRLWNVWVGGPKKMIIKIK